MAAVDGITLQTPARVCDSVHRMPLVVRSWLLKFPGQTLSSCARTSYRALRGNTCKWARRPSPRRILLHRRRSSPPSRAPHRERPQSEIMGLSLRPSPCPRPRAGWPTVCVPISNCHVPAYSRSNICSPKQRREPPESERADTARPTATATAAASAWFNDGDETRPKGPKAIDAPRPANAPPPGEQWMRNPPSAPRPQDRVGPDGCAP